MSRSGVQQRLKMKRVGSIKQALRPSLKSNSANNDAVNNNESKNMNSTTTTSNSNSNSGGGSGLSILGNFGPPQSNGHNKPDFHLPKSISSFLKAGKGTLTRNKKDKSNQVSILKTNCYIILTMIQKEIFHHFFYNFPSLRGNHFLFLNYIKALSNFFFINSGKLNSFNSKKCVLTLNVAS